MKKIMLVLLSAAMLLALCACGQREKETELLVFLEENLSEIEERNIGVKINVIDDVQSATYISGEEALNAFIEQQESEEAFSGMDGVLRGRYSVSVKTADLDGVMEQLEAIEGVDEVAGPPEIGLGQIFAAWLQSKIKD